ncbi:ETC complex I subunit [Alphaproteobacteria bacterium]|nr:ETC complex I subunit [Alphaproteobacteria bacterium]
MRAIIHKPSKTAMQSGRNGNVSRGNAWVLSYPRSKAARPDSLMGWQSSSDTARQVRIRFPSKEAAIAYAEAHDIAYELHEPSTRRVKPRAYADNFAYGRKGAWTH